MHQALRTSKTSGKKGAQLHRETGTIDLRRSVKGAAVEASSRVAVCSCMTILIHSDVLDPGNNGEGVWLFHTASVFE